MIKRIKSWFPIIFIIAVALWSVWPVIVSPHDSLVAGDEDVLITWILNQTIQKIPNRLSEIFQGNIFHPFKNTMAYSVLLIPSALLGLIPAKLTGFPVLAFNTAFIFGQVLTMLVTYLWFKEMTKNTLASLLGSIILGLSQIRFHHIVHLQMWTMQWWLISGWMIWKFSKYGKIRHLYLSAIFAVIQIWECLLPIYFILATGAFLLLFEFRKILKVKNIRKHLIIALLLFFIFSSPVLFTYFSVSKQFDYVRPIREVAHFSMSINDLWGMYFSPVLYFFLIISLLMVLSFWKKSRSVGRLIESQRNFKWIFTVGFVGLIMSLGPVLKWQGKTIKLFGRFFIPLPYGIFYYIIPGLNGLRSPARWLWLVAFAVSGLIAVIFAKNEALPTKVGSIFSLTKDSCFISKLKFGDFAEKCNKIKHKNQIIVLGILLAILGGTKVTDTKLIPTPNQYPKVYTWLEKQKGEVILELPIYTWGAGEIYKNEMYRMLYSLKHRKKLVNGASGFYPPESEKLARDLWNDFPSNDLDDELTNLEVDYVIVHRDEYDNEKLVKIETWGKDNVVWKDETVFVFKLKPKN